jgi:RNA polymerase II C-terminal domain phosphatase-like 3/4
MMDCWKGENQDAYVAAPVGSDALLLGVFDGHGRGGELASRAAAAGLAAALPEARARLQAQPALVRAFRQAAASMQADGRYKRCGAAGVACLVEPGSITAAWAGDCRAVVGLSVEGPARPTVLVHALTRDHKPSR